MYSLREYADTLHTRLSRVATQAVPDLQPDVAGSPVSQTRFEVESLLVRGSLPVASEAALKGLARQPTLGASAKLAWSAREGFELVAEVPRQRNLGQAEAEVRDTLDEALAWLSNGVASDANGTAPPSSSLVENLKEAGCFVLPAASGGCFADANLGGSVYRVLVAEYSDAKVRLSFPTTTVRIDDERTLYATTLFALEANRRLRLARASVTPLSTDRTRLAWDVVVNNGPSLTRRLAEALEALVVSRDETARALRMLRNRAVADVYLAARVGHREQTE